MTMWSEAPEGVSLKKAHEINKLWLEILEVLHIKTNKKK